VKGGRPAPPQDRPPRHNTDDTHSTVLSKLFGHAPHEPLTPEDREDLNAIVAAAERGFRVAVRCSACGHWLSNPRSVRAFLGPRCAARAVSE
jgi:primosomal protein N'